MEKRLVANRWKTPDGTVLESVYTHDFVQYHDKVADDDYFIDGGIDYVRHSVNDIPMQDCCVWSTDPITVVREYFKRGTFDKDGNRIYVLIKNLSDAHLQNIIKDSDRLDLSNGITIQYIRELAYRFDNNISIPEKQYTKEDQ